MSVTPIDDTNVYDGLNLILSKFPDATILSELGCLYVPEALSTSFDSTELSALAALGWVIDHVNGGLKYNTVRIIKDLGEVTAVSSSVIADFLSYKNLVINLNNQSTINITLYTPYNHDKFCIKLVEGDTISTTVVTFSAQGGKTVYIPTGGLIINTILNGVTLVKCDYLEDWYLNSISMQ